jgi:PucR family transcriptional regulator, purine catabolism regulatory protein
MAEARVRLVRELPDPPGLEALDAVTDAVESGSGLPDVARATARALDASVAVVDATGAVLAVAARSPADEASLLRDGADVRLVDLRVAEAAVGQMRLRLRGPEPQPSVLRLVGALVASEVERVRGPERASEEAAASFLRDVLAGRIASREDLVGRGQELGIDLAAGGSVIVARGHPVRAVEAGWRRRLLAAVERAVRGVAPGAIAAVAEDVEDVVVLLPDEGGAIARRAADAVARELEATMNGFTFTVGRSSVGSDPAGLRRAGGEALLAANVAEGDTHSVLGYEELGTYRLIFSLFMDHREELQRFFAETVEPLVAYDDQYETDLVGTLETFLDCDANVNATAQRLITHRHTVRYRLERARELSGLDVGSSDGRERLSLGLKAMRVLGLAAARGPATERGAAAGRVRREGKDR